MRYIHTELHICTPKKEKNKNKQTSKTPTTAFLKTGLVLVSTTRATGADMPDATTGEDPGGDPFMGETVWTVLVNYGCCNKSPSQ